MENLKMNHDTALFMDDGRFRDLGMDEKVELFGRVQEWLDRRTDVWNLVFDLQSQGRNDQADLLLALL